MQGCGDREEQNCCIGVPGSTENSYQSKPQANPGISKQLINNREHNYEVVVDSRIVESLKSEMQSEMQVQESEEPKFT
jgi:hypothetical protein